MHNHLTNAFVSQFPYRFQRMDSVPGTRACSGVEHHLIFYSHSSQWASSGCMPHQSGHSAVQDPLWNLFSHYPGNSPPLASVPPPFPPRSRIQCVLLKDFLELHHFPSIPTALIFPQLLISQLFLIFQSVCCLV